jgi:hypothetical protein
VDQDRQFPDENSGSDQANGAQGRTGSIDCDSVLALIPAYSFGATDPTETALVKVGLTQCPDAAAELQSYTELADAMLYAAPQVQPPPQLLNKLMTATREAKAPTPLASPVRRIPRPRLREWAAAALLLLLLGSNAYWMAQVNTLQSSQHNISAQLTDQAEAVALLSSDKAQRIALASATEDDKPWALMICDPDGTFGYLKVTKFPPQGPEKTYQLWLIEGKRWVSAGLLHVDDKGAGTAYVRAPYALRQFDEVAITLEPNSGSAKPSAPSLIRNRLYGANWEGY